MTGTRPIIKVVATDIIELGKTGRVDCIVNPANRELAEGGTLCGEIYNAAASNHLDDDLRGALGISEGSALLTKGHNLCPLIIHTLAPKSEDEAKWPKHRDCYVHVLNLADWAFSRHGLKSIAIPALGTGAHGLSSDKADLTAADIAVNSGFRGEIILCFAPDYDGSERAERIREHLIESNGYTEDEMVFTA
jgi:O-acetyl-ADP-ribose deacetylase (regulator of RNase III)